MRVQHASIDQPKIRQEEDGVIAVSSYLSLSVDFDNAEEAREFTRTLRRYGHELRQAIGHALIAEEGESDGK